MQRLRRRFGARRRSDKDDQDSISAIAARQKAFDQFSAAVELPMLILTIVMVPVLIIPYTVHHIRPGAQSVLDTVDYFIWAAFLFEYLVRLVLVPRRWHFVTHNLPDLIIVAVPMLRPLRVIRSVRVLRAMRLSRLTALAGEGAQKSKRSLHARTTNYVLVLTGTLILVTSVVVLDLERQVKGSNIKSFGDALWWAISTVTTVGYGDRYPVSAGGRAVAAVLMLCGIGLIGVVTAAIAAYFVGQSGQASERSGHAAELLRRLEAIESLLTARANATPDGDRSTAIGYDVHTAASASALGLRRLIGAVTGDASSTSRGTLDQLNRSVVLLEELAARAPNN